MDIQEENVQELEVQEEVLAYDDDESAADGHHEVGDDSENENFAEEVEVEETIAHDDVTEEHSEVIDEEHSEVVDNVEVEEETVVSGGEDPMDKEEEEEAEADNSANYSLSSGENVYDEGKKHQDVDFDDDVDVEDEKNDEHDQNDQNVDYHETEGDEAGEDEKAANMPESMVLSQEESDSEKPPADETANTAEKQGAGGEEFAKDIADIFGDSGDEDDGEDFDGFDAGEDRKKRKIVSDSESDDEDRDDHVQQADGGDDEQAPEEKPQQSGSDDDDDQQGHSGNLVYDFDIIMAKKKSQNKSRRRRDGGTNISDVDDIVNSMLLEMKTAADEDREAVKNKKPALAKLKMLKRVVSHINKTDMKESFIEMGVYSAISDWLTPIQDYNLPHLSIRRELLKVLNSLPSASAETLISSKVGRAVMLIFKHPKEIRANKEIASRIINKWSRPLFGLNENFKSMSRCEREERDLQTLPPSKRKKTEDAEAGTSSASGPGATTSGESDIPLRPGDKGFVMRARVPMPSNKDYVVRPKWKVGQGEGNEDGEVGPTYRVKKSKAKKDARLDKHIKNFAEKKKRRKMQRAVQISIEGNRMKIV